MEDKAKVIKYINDIIMNGNPDNLLDRLSDEVPDKEYGCSEDKSLFSLLDTNEAEIFVNYETTNENKPVTYIFAINYNKLYIITVALLSGMTNNISVTEFTLDRMISIIEGGNNE